MTNILMYEDLLLEKAVLPFLSNLDTELDRSSFANISVYQAVDLKGQDVFLITRSSPLLIILFVKIITCL